jgi:hypothetical protein
MLRCIFVGSPNRFTDLMVHWLSRHTDFVGAVWTSSAEWAKTFPKTLQFAQRRVARFGLAKTFNEICYYWLSRKLLKDHGEPFQTRLYNDYVQAHGRPSWQGDSIRTDNINSPQVVNFVRERHPDVIMSMCINEFFKREIRDLPRLGSFLWHEGIVPEYKGLYSPFWAMHNCESEMLGYSVLRMNGRYDEGEVYLQGRATGINPKTDSPLYIGHKAILDSLPGVAILLDQLERGIAKPLSLEGRPSGTYTYPGLTDWIRMRWRLRGSNGELPEAQTVEPGGPLAGFENPRSRPVVNQDSVQQVD